MNKDILSPQVLFWLEQEELKNDDNFFIPADTPPNSLKIYKHRRRMCKERHQRVLARLIQKQADELIQLHSRCRQSVDPSLLPADRPMMDHHRLITGKQYVRQNKQLFMQAMEFVMQTEEITTEDTTSKQDTLEEYTQDKSSYQQAIQKPLDGALYRMRLKHLLQRNALLLQTHDSMQKLISERDLILEDQQQQKEQERQEQQQESSCSTNQQTLIHTTNSKRDPRKRVEQGFIDQFDQLAKEIQYPLDGVNRTYYVAIDEVIWDYAPSGKDHVHNTSLEESPAHLYMFQTPTSIGTQYYKAQYREYTDDSYSELKQVKPWHGGMGPIFRAEVGDTLVIHVWNRAQYNFTMHPHGVFYEFEMEGAVYKGTTNDSFIHPGGRHTYIWQVHPRAGPGPNDGHSLVWGYHSHMTEYDIFAGLYGAIIIYRHGHWTPDLSDNEVVTTVFGSDENLSPYMKKTMDQRIDRLDQQSIDKMTGDPTPFYLSNVKQMINGLMLDRSMVFRRGQTVTWHLLAWGSFLDIQDLRWENGQVELYGKSITHLRLLPASFRTVLFTPHDQGIWNFGYLNGEQGVHGMIMQYQVE
ncbi:Cupredoxin [Halteromyces radiatus]|uniref:Cupredoxin n=1 Tax=Halteromyces radiatus TaxID=101107 RepID=UPI00221E4BDC|nr:Cupredoxin [Halteromyces radiatus]KAI8089984.1 Cupredoxin [Halteromyces radiatus]